MTLEVSDRTYNIIWVCVFSLHAGCLAYLVSGSYLLWYVDSPQLLYLVYYVMPPSEVHFPVYSAIVALVGVLHALALVRLVVLTSLVGRLALNAPPDVFKDRWHRLTKAASDRVSVWRYSLKANDQTTVSARSTQPSCKESSKASLFRLADALTDRFDKMFGMHSPYFHEVLMAREVLEISAQAYQAYRCSTIIARSSINDTFISTVILNCWSTSLLHAIFVKHNGHNVLLERIACIAVDGVLNLITSTIIPVVLFMPYYFAYDPAIASFDAEHFYDTTWFAAFITECQLVFPVTVIDFVSKLTPHVSTFMCIFTIVPLIARRPRQTTLSDVWPAAVDKDQHTKEKIEKTAPSQAPHSSFSKPLTAVSYLVVAIGCVLMTLHIHSKVYINNREQPGCRHKTYPWFPSKFPCMVFEYNCYRHGTSTVTSNELEALEFNSLHLLTFSHCEALVIPPSIQQFPELVGFMIYNSTVTEWPIDAGFAATQIKLASVIFARVNFTSFPAGLQSPLPPMLADIEFAHSNLTAIPDNLHEYWPNLDILLFEHCQFTEFPETLTKISINYFSLLGNYISNMSLLADMTSMQVALNFNPVQHLPDQLTGTRSFFELSLENMRLQTIPDWLRTDVASAYLYGNPFCDNITADEGSVRCFMRDLFPDGMVVVEYFRHTMPC